jgi:hypothetical protein
MQIEEKQTILEPFSMAKPESAQRAEEKWPSYPRLAATFRLLLPSF